MMSVSSSLSSSFFVCLSLLCCTVELVSSVPVSSLSGSQNKVIQQNQLVQLEDISTVSTTSTSTATDCSAPATLQYDAGHVAKVPHFSVPAGTTPIHTLFPMPAVVDGNTYLKVCQPLCDANPACRFVNAYDQPDYPDPHIACDQFTVPDGCEDYNGNPTLASCNGVIYNGEYVYLKGAPRVLYSAVTNQCVSACTADSGLIPCHVPDCPTEQCMSSCDASQDLHLFNGACVKTCPPDTAGWLLTDTNTCSPTCPAGYIWNSNQGVTHCERACPVPYLNINNMCVPPTPCNGWLIADTNVCAPSCPSGYNWCESNNPSCAQAGPSFNLCVRKCPFGANHIQTCNPSFQQSCTLMMDDTSACVGQCPRPPSNAALKLPYYSIQTQQQIPGVPFRSDTRIKTCVTRCANNRVSTLVNGQRQCADDDATNCPDDMGWWHSSSSYCQPSCGWAFGMPNWCSVAVCGIRNSCVWSCPVAESGDICVSSCPASAPHFASSIGQCVHACQDVGLLNCESEGCDGTNSCVSSCPLCGYPSTNNQNQQACKSYNKIEDPLKYQDKPSSCNR